MQSDQSKFSIKESFQLVKFDGDPPKPGELKEPAEVIEGDGITTKTIYRANEGDTKQIYIGRSDGYAELHSVTRR